MGMPPGQPPDENRAGKSLAHFELLELLGAGGFGEVYRARDTRLGRTVAIKLLPETFARDAERRERFRREAIAASALNHPNICTVHDLVEAGGQFLIVMEFVEGKTLQAALADGPLPPSDVLPIAIQVADALAEAHRAGILHRDVKCGNIALTPRGQAKVLDFGLAKLVGAGDTEGSTLEKVTAEGTTSGTLGYMSPEQLLGKPLDRRSDLFSFGVVLYEMVTAQLPFQGGSAIAVVNAILHSEPRDFGDLPVPGGLKAIIRRLLQKEPGKRYASAEKLLLELRALEASTAPGRRPALSRGVRIGMAAAAVVVLAAAGWVWHRWSRERWALGTAKPEAARLVEVWEFPRAAALIREARTVLPKDPELEKLWTRATGEASIDSVPSGADVSVRPYRGDPEAWQSLGRTPVGKVRIPKDVYVWRIAKPGYSTVHFLAGTSSEGMAHLPPEGEVPPGMVPVRGNDKAMILLPSLRDAPRVAIADYLIDRHEVTNEEYRRFVDAGGYRRRELWKVPFLKEGQTIPWQEAVVLFVDTTGRPGPSTWEVGTFRPGLEKHPVAGVSWYEAAAFAEFAGKSLPTLYHWMNAAETHLAQVVVPGSNFRGAGTQPVGGAGTLSGFGTTDMAGNVKEWCWNEGRENERYVLGGGFGEPDYLFVEGDASSPWDRGSSFGFRCAKLTSPPPPAALARLETSVRDFAREAPISDEVFRAFKGLYAYDKGELHARLEEKEVTAEWTREKVSFDAAYGGERVVAHLYLPVGQPPPFQAVVCFPGSGALYQEKLNTSFLWGDGFVPRSGRALLIPIYKGTYERRDGTKSDQPDTTARWRDHMIAWSKDLGRSVDYLETRKDVDPTRIGYIGHSWGGAIAPILLAVDDRFKAAVLLSAGLESRSALPEAEPISFVTRLKLPVLMVNGRFDYFYPVKTAQLPLLQLLGTPTADKRHVLYETNHATPRTETIRESLDWLDRYLGPVRR